LADISLMGVLESRFLTPGDRRIKALGETHAFYVIQLTRLIKSVPGNLQGLVVADSLNDG
jgi:hypothetical protein